MRLDEIAGNDRQLDEILPTIGAAVGGIARGAATVGNAALKGGAALAKNVGSAVSQGAKAVGNVVSKGANVAGQIGKAVGQAAQAGGMAEYRPVGYWWASVPEERWPQDEDSQKWIRSKWAEPFGDRRQELVFIGQKLQKESMLAELERCLLTPSELRLGLKRWPAAFPDPFPSWTENSTPD